MRFLFHLRIELVSSIEIKFYFDVVLFILDVRFPTISNFIFDDVGLRILNGCQNGRILKCQCRGGCEKKPFIKPRRVSPVF